MLMGQLDVLLSRDETFWRQRSRTQWLKDGDRNTKFFHQRASKWRRKNIIKGLKDEVGFWQDSPESIKKVMVEYFRKIFRSRGVLPNAVSEVMEVVSPKVTP